MTIGAEERCGTIAICYLSLIASAALETRSLCTALYTECIGTHVHGHTF